MKCHFCGKHIEFFRFQSYFSEYHETVSIRIVTKCPKCRMVYETMIPLDDKMKAVKYYFDITGEEVKSW